MKDKSIEILQKEKCSGCSACYPVCPTNAITMEYDEEGFLYPIVNYDKCTNCGLCSKVCPELNFEFDNKKTPKCYAMQATDEIRMKSSSGGMFTILADYIFERGGFVCGVAFNKNENWKVEHIIIDKKEDLDKLRGSKYVQSDKKDIFKQIKELLNKDKYVLFSGCPCEVAGLKNYLRKNYDKLILVDLLCGSVESLKIYEKYFLDEKSNKTIISVEYPRVFSLGKNERYYPINNEKNDKLYNKYLSESKKLNNVYFFGRLGDYKYYNMDLAVERVFELFEKLKNSLFRNK